MTNKPGRAVKGQTGGIPDPTSGLGRRTHRRWRSIHLVALVALAALTITALSYDGVVHAAQHRTEGSLLSTRLRLERTRTTLSTTNEQITSTIAVRDARQTAQSRTVAAIAAATQNLGTASKTGFLQTLDIASLTSCLSGVSNAVTAIGSANLQGAVSSITAVSSACLSLDGSSAGLTYPFDFADPFILTVGTQYYAFATNSVAGNIQIIKSSDLSHWTTVGDALPHLAAWAQPGATWAPGVLQRGNTYVLYYSAVFGTSGQQCLSAAVATQPQGPYVDTSTAPIECQLDMGGSIDPSPWVEADGTPYLTWKSQGANGQPPTLWSQPLTPDGTALMAGSPSALLTPSQSWQGGVIEGPDMVVSGGQHLLFYSANDWRTANYAIGVASCSGPLGPCIETSTQPLLGSQQGFSGPGGPSVFSNAQGNLWMAFHGWLPGKVGFPNSRLLFLRPVTLSAGTAPSGP
jgi:hypothetical protein